MRSSQVNYPDLDELRIDTLRAAIRENRVSFPAQIPTFAKHDRPDVQRKVVQLYFVLGWPSERIAPRYRLSRIRVQQILKTWMTRAVELGYIQSIPLMESAFPYVDRHPVRVLLKPVVNDALAPIVRISERVPSEVPTETVQQTACRTGSRKGPRPRRRFDPPQIAGVLKQLQAGRRVSDMANEVGASRGSIYRWMEQEKTQPQQSSI
jgi:transposase